MLTLSFHITIATLWFCLQLGPGPRLCHRMRGRGFRFFGTCTRTRSSACPATTPWPLPSKPSTRWLPQARTTTSHSSSYSQTQTSTDTGSLHQGLLTIASGKKERIKIICKSFGLCTSAMTPIQCWITWSI